ncbi:MULTISPECIES: TetR/AcrR family transcriptional regulator [Bradyrhizobium]|uniref:TetR/AcrR family transcriptional regulator n=1 Tax=Bradyrhizobium TaxID=374 RepID=UPI000576D608|nr:MULTISPECIES: TetR/AcrR family transcriptional regulator [unclassified Bradyrhizobium]MDA9452602.1 TetR family transcriptional regulator [Bradyrhizobium sp. CCBAU 21360]MDA9457495.1 TetR family transcriptional regulator [Bradyrhizobium sp. CCBAU 21359]MDA9515736.1 TetR family transcriptional regulator [Bradyrhizobium sp. CCBAU 11430]BBO12930.1 TetR family transcriptional regulator [Bradyrhizobium sp. TM102]
MAQSRASKEQLAVAAATEVFSRYGYARTTMGDIASEAVISRPALYLLFPDKDAVFAAVIRGMDEQKHREIRAAIARLDGLHAKLLHACKSWGCHGFDLVEAHPDSADLFDLRFPAVRQVYDNFQSLVVELIGDQVRSARGADEPEVLARCLVFGMRGLRETARSGKEMRRLIAVQVAMLVRSIGGKT